MSKTSPPTMSKSAGPQSAAAAAAGRASSGGGTPPPPAPRAATPPPASPPARHSRRGLTFPDAEAPRAAAAETDTCSSLGGRSNGGRFLWCLITITLAVTAHSVGSAGGLSRMLIVALGGVPNSELAGATPPPALPRASSDHPLASEWQRQQTQQTMGIAPLTPPGAWPPPGVLPPLPQGGFPGAVPLPPAGPPPTPRPPDPTPRPAAPAAPPPPVVTPAPADDPLPFNGVAVATPPGLLKLRSAADPAAEYVGGVTGGMEDGEPLRMLRRRGLFIRIRTMRNPGADLDEWRGEVAGWVRAKYLVQWKAPFMFKVGDTIAEYRVSAQIMRSGQAQAYRVTGPQGRPAALKVFVDDATVDLGNNSKARDGRLAKAFHKEEGIMQKVQDCDTVVRYYSSGLFKGMWYVAMQPLAESLSGLPVQLRKLRDNPDITFRPSTVARTGVQALNALECFHDKGFVHRDQKAGNWMLGIGTEWSEVHLIDFGLAQQLRHPNGTRTPPTYGFQGTYRYATLNQHRRREMTRRDDVWGLFYVLMELALGGLPWKGVSPMKEEFKMQKMKEKYCSKQQAEEWLRPLPQQYLQLWLHILSLYPDLPAELKQPPPLPGKMRKFGTRGKSMADPDPQYDYMRGLLGEVCGGDCKAVAQEWMDDDWPRKVYDTPAPPAATPQPAAAATPVPAGEEGAAAARYGPPPSDPGAPASGGSSTDAGATEGGDGAAPPAPEGLHETDGVEEEEQEPDGAAPAPGAPPGTAPSGTADVTQLSSSDTQPQSGPASERTAGTEADGGER